MSPLARSSNHRFTRTSHVVTHPLNAGQAPTQCAPRHPPAPSRDDAPRRPLQKYYSYSRSVKTRPIRISCRKPTDAMAAQSLADTHLASAPQARLSPQPMRHAPRTYTYSTCTRSKHFQETSISGECATHNHAGSPKSAKTSKECPRRRSQTCHACSARAYRETQFGRKPPQLTSTAAAQAPG